MTPLPGNGPSIWRTAAFRSIRPCREPCAGIDDLETHRMRRRALNMRRTKKAANVAALFGFLAADRATANESVSQVTQAKRRTATKPRPASMRMEQASDLRSLRGTALVAVS